MVIDDVIVNGDHELLVVLALGFLILMFVQTFISLARSWVLMRWSMDVSIQWSSRVFAHMLRLPVEYFEKRQLGDVLSRFGSIGAIQGTLTSVFVESLLDGMMAILALVMMAMYSTYLTLFVVTATLLYAALRWAFYQPFREASQERLALSAKEGTHFLESIRAISALKLFGRESGRLSQWQNLKLDVQNRDVKIQKLSILFKTSNTFIFGTQGIALLYFGAGLVISNELTVGMLMAFTSYSGTFTGRVSKLIDVFVSIKMLSLHSERLADIVLEEAEPQYEFETDLSRIRSSIEVRNLRFRYSDGEPWILDNVNLSISSGQSIALVGPSGCGKTTLCKIILGLLKPTEGEVLVGGIPIKQLGLASYRQMVGTVMQEDTLLAGSIAENISFFDEQFDMERIAHCAFKAAIHEEITAMPMGYQTLVGDMGSSLSGGQKQRLLLARALYKRPKILALDEATSHLDLQSEARVNVGLRDMEVTRLMVAHRPETIRMADRVIKMEKGRLVEVELVKQQAVG
jgi:ATP-binding cassette subfamily B protein RaxB